MALAINTAICRENSNNELLQSDFDTNKVYQHNQDKNYFVKPTLTLTVSIYVFVLYSFLV